MAGESAAFRRSLRGWESAETVDRYIAYVRFKALEQDVPARLERLPDGLPFG
jgi:hypothetical protein